MTQSLQFDFTVSDCRIPRRVAERVAEAVRKMDGKRMVMTLAKAKRASTDPQRRYYFGVVIPAVMEIFYSHGTALTKDECHQWMKRHIGKLLKNVVTPDGEVTEILRSYTELDTMETEVYHTLCRAWAAEQGCNIPEPNETEQSTTSEEAHV